MQQDLMAVKRIDGYLKNNTPLLADIIQLLHPSYIDVTQLLEREIQYCNTTYAHYNDDGILNSFFMVNWETVLNKPSVFCGLSAVNQSIKNSGLASFVYLKFILDAIKWETIHNKRLILYATLATPSSYNVIKKMFCCEEPDANKNYSDLSKQVVIEFCKKRNFKYREENPFILKNFASNTLYSDEEVTRINNMKQKHGFDLFESWGIDERKGDRLFLVFKTPQYEKFQSVCEKWNIILAGN